MKKKETNNKNTPKPLNLPVFVRRNGMNTFGEWSAIFEDISVIKYSKTLFMIVVTETDDGSIAAIQLVAGV